MGLFSTDNTALALEVGRLTAEVAALRAEVAALRDARVPATPDGASLPAQVTALIDGLSRGEKGLARHLEDEARRMLAFGVEEGQVLETLYAGALS